MALRISAILSWFKSRVPSSPSRPIGCWAWLSSVALSGELNRIWVGGGDGRRKAMLAWRDQLSGPEQPGPDNSYAMVSGHNFSCAPSTESATCGAVIFGVAALGP